MDFSFLYLDYTSFRPIQAYQSASELPLIDTSLFACSRTMSRVPRTSHLVGLRFTVLKVNNIDLSALKIAIDVRKTAHLSLLDLSWFARGCASLSPPCEQL